MMEAASASEMPVNFYHTVWLSNSKVSHLYSRRRENLKSHRDEISNSVNTGIFLNHLKNYGERSSVEVL
jgi:hypothetical protein